MADARSAPLLRRARILRPQLIAPAAMLAFGIVATQMSAGLSIGSLTEPQPGLWPFVVSLLIVASAAVLVFTDEPREYERWGRGTTRVASGLVTLTTFIMLFQVLGFALSAGLLMLAWMRLHGRETWKVAVPLAVVGALVLQVLFVDVFGVPFPEGLVIALRAA